MILALFDFDGTLTTKDSFMYYLPHAVTKIKLFLGFFYLLPFILLYTLKLIKSHILKEKAMTLFFKGQDKDTFIQNCRIFTRSHLKNILIGKGLEKLAWHQAQGHRVVIVSANFEEYLSDWCKSQQVELIASRLETDSNNKLTGRILGNNCHGQEKVNRIKSYLKIEEYEKIYAYGNSRGDKEMLAMAHEGFFRHFN